MRRFDRLPKVSDSVYEGVEAECKRIAGWDAEVTTNTISGGLNLVAETKGRLMDGITSVGAELKPKQRRAIAFDLYFLLRLINDALAEGG